MSVSYNEMHACMGAFTHTHVQRHRHKINFKKFKLLNATPAKLTKLISPTINKDTNK